MQGYTQVTAVGNLVRDPEVRNPAGYFVLRGTVAVNESSKGKKSTLYMEFEVWNDYGKNILPFLQKGKAIMVVGKLKEDSWTENGTGQKKSKMLISADKVILLGGSSQDGKGDESTPIGTNPSDGWGKPPATKATPTDKAPQGWEPPADEKGLSMECPF